MGFTDVLRAFRANWLIVAGAIVVTIVIGIAVSFAQPRSYQVSAQLYVSSKTDPSGTDTYQGMLVAQQAVPTYVLLLSSDEAVTRALRSIGSDESSADVISRIKTSFVPDTQVIDLSLTDNDANRAAQLINALSRQFSTMVDELNAKSNPSATNAKVTLVRPADVPSSPVSRNTPRNAAIALVVGLALAFAFVYIRETLRRRKPDVQDGAVPDVPRLEDRPTVVADDRPSAGDDQAAPADDQSARTDVESDPKDDQLTTVDDRAEESADDRIAAEVDEPDDKE